MTRKVLLVGATGVFGSRLAAMIAGMAGVDLLLAARREGPLLRLNETLIADGAAATIEVVVFDRLRPDRIAEIAPWLVIDASGPFQDANYGFALAVVGAGAHYIDLADSRAFVAGFPLTVNAAAIANGAFAVTAASSTPALSHAALDLLTKGWRSVDEVGVAISPGARAPRGAAVIEAILSYVGRPVRVFRDGGWTVVPGWSGARRLQMPGLGLRWASICETPDLDLLPGRFTVRRSAMFFAGLELPLMHFGLTLLSLPVRWKLARSLQLLARPLRLMAGLLAPLGSDDGGMIAWATGSDGDGAAITARWALWARDGAGPNTPAAPAAALARALLRDGDLPRGAMPCVGYLDLETILSELAGMPIHNRFDESHPQSRVLFRRLLGRRFESLPPAVRSLHGRESAATFAGRAIARSGRGWIASAMRRLLNLPVSGPSEIEVRIVPDRSGEVWTRKFGPSQFASRLKDVRLGVFEERFGPLSFAFELDRSNAGVVWRLVGWSALRIPLPLGFAPKMHAKAEERGGLYRFQVAVAHRWTGLLFAYRGYLTEVAG